LPGVLRTLTLIADCMKPFVSDLQSSNSHRTTVEMFRTTAPRAQVLEHISDSESAAYSDHVYGGLKTQLERWFDSK